MVSLVGNGNAQVVADVLAQRQLAVHIIALHRAEGRILLCRPCGARGEVGAVYGLAQLVDVALAGKLVRGMPIAYQVIRFGFKCRVITSRVGVAHIGAEGGQLGLGLLLRLWPHPLQGINAFAESSQEVVDDVLHARLVLRWEELGNVSLAHRLAHCGIDQALGQLPLRFVLWHTA